MARLRAVAVVVALLCLLAQGTCVSQRLSKDVLPRKNLAGSPSQFANKALPNPSASASNEQSALFKLNFNTPLTADETLCFSQALYVDSKEAFAFSLFLPAQDSVTFHLYNPSSEEVALEDHLELGTFPLGDTGNAVPTATYSFTAPFATGLWTLTGECRTDIKSSTTDPDLLILLWNQADVQVYSQLSTFALVEGNNVGLQATLFNSKIDNAWRLEGRRPSPKAQSQVWLANMHVITPKGQRLDITMYDDGLHGDGAANDGYYGALVPAVEIGTYEAQAILSGFTPDGIQFLRTAQHLMRIVPANVALAPTAVSTPMADGTIDIMMGITYNDTEHPESYTAYAEVWGTASNGTLVPVAWIGGAVDAAEYKKQVVMTLVLHSKWLALAQAKEPIVLRNVYVQNQLIPITQASQITVQGSSRIPAKFLKAPVSVVDEEMRWGVRPKHLRVRKITGDDTPNLILSHGYCAVTNPFADKVTDFTNALMLDDLDASRTNDEFANIIAKFGQDHNMPSFGIAAHSQGGLASTHLHNYYWSGLESAVGARLIQTVGSPYGGSGMAGSSADLGRIFGVGCGANFDLTHDGAALWIKGIQTDKVTHDVYYYTTQYNTGGLVNYCNLGSNLLLKWPNDGMTEKDYSDLPGGNDIAHTKGECHTTSMAFPPQCWDSTRNAEINKNAAR